jgi:hypothetical protein
MHDDDTITRVACTVMLDRWIAGSLDCWIRVYRTKECQCRHSWNHKYIQRMDFAANAMFAFPKRRVPFRLGQCRRRFE